MDKRVVLAVITVIALVVVAPTVWSQPNEDRVGFPENYRDRFIHLYTLDRPHNKQVRVVYSNQSQEELKEGQPFPYGTVLVMETYRAEQSAAGEPILDADGRFVPGELTGIFVSRKERGFGVDCGEFRNGEWEYVAYRPDGSHLIPPENSTTCAMCHLDAGPSRDWVYRANLFFAGASGALPEGIIQSYVFVPSVIRARVGSTVT